MKSIHQIDLLLLGVFLHNFLHVYVGASILQKIYNTYHCISQVTCMCCVVLCSGYCLTTDMQNFGWVTVGLRLHVRQPDPSARAHMGEGALADNPHPHR